MRNKIEYHEGENTDSEDFKEMLKYLDESTTLATFEQKKNHAAKISKK